MDALDFSMLSEKACHLCCVFRVRTHSPRQGAHSTQNQPTIEGRGDRTARILNRANPLEKFAVFFCDDDSAEHIAVSAEIFRRGVENQICTELERPLQNRRPGIIANAERTCVMNDFRYCSKIDNF